VTRFDTVVLFDDDSRLEHAQAALSAPLGDRALIDAGTGRRLG
jgi:hypothetical protein